MPLDRQPADQTGDRGVTSAALEAEEEVSVWPTGSG
jgi:hypothetical protein